MVVLCLATSRGWVSVDYSGRWPCGWPSERFAWCISNVQSWIIEPVRWLGFLCSKFPSDKLERHIWQASNPSKTWAPTHPNKYEGLQLDWLLISLFQRLKPIGAGISMRFSKRNMVRVMFFLMHQNGPTGVSHIYLCLQVICHGRWPESPSSSTGSSDAQKRALHHTLAQQNLEGGNKGFEQWWCFEKTRKKLTGLIGANWSKWYFGNYISYTFWFNISLHERYLLPYVFLNLLYPEFPRPAHWQIVSYVADVFTLFRITHSFLNLFAFQTSHHGELAFSLTT